MIYNSIVTMKPGDQYFPHLSRLPWTGNKWGMPQQLIVQGDPACHKLLTQGWSIAIVGTRKPTPFAAQIIDRLVGSLAHMDVTIISGLCPGIDELAHRAALKYKLKQMAMLPMLPFGRLRDLGEEILQSGGLLVSEMEYHERANLRELYTRRNRITAALSNIILPIQAGAESGTLNCCQQGRELGIPSLVYLPQTDVLGNPGQYDGLVAMAKAGQADRWNFTEEKMGYLTNILVDRQVEFLGQIGRADLAQKLLMTWQGNGQARYALAEIMAAQNNSTMTVVLP